MSRLRLVAYSELKKIAERVGFQWVRCEGSHNSFRNSDGQTIIIPNHGSKVIVRPLLRKIIRDLGLSIDDYNRLLDLI